MAGDAVIRFRALRPGVLLPALLLLVQACASAPPGGEEARRQGLRSARIMAATVVPPLNQVSWGIFARSPGEARPVLAVNPARLFVPASNVKLLTTAAALDRLGPDHWFETVLVAGGPVDPGTGTLQGDLVLRASGDPTLSRRFWPSDRAPLEALADSLAAAGVRVVDGALVVDVSSWPEPEVPGSWMVEDLPWGYGAPPAAFAVAEAEIRVELRAGSVSGAPVEVSWLPLGEEGAVAVDGLVTGPADAEDDVAVRWLPERGVIELRGMLPAGRTDTLTLAARDPARHAAAELHRVLEEEGIRVRDGWRVRRGRDGLSLPGDPPLLVRLVSPPLIEVVEVVLEESRNWIAEQLVLALAAAEGRPGSRRAGLEVVEAYAAEVVGAPGPAPILRDGSGLSVQSLATPLALVAVLEDVAARPWGDAYRRALAEPGEEDSTLEERLRGLEGRLWAKTGTLTWVSALSGWLVDEEGRTVAFSIMTNGSGLPGSLVRDGIDTVVREMATGR